MDNIETQVIELLEAGVEPAEIAKLLDLEVEEVLDIEDYACECRDDDYDGQPDEQQEWYDFDPDC